MMSALRPAGGCLGCQSGAVFGAARPLQASQQPLVSVAGSVAPSQIRIAALRLTLNAESAVCNLASLVNPDPLLKTKQVQSGHGLLKTTTHHTMRSESLFFPPAIHSYTGGSGETSRPGRASNGLRCHQSHCTN